MVEKILAGSVYKDWILNSSDSEYNSLRLARMARTTLVNHGWKKISGSGTNLDKLGMPKQQHVTPIIPDLCIVNAYQVDLKMFK